MMTHFTNAGAKGVCLNNSIKELVHFDKSGFAISIVSTYILLSATSWEIKNVNELKYPQIKTLRKLDPRAT